MTCTRTLIGLISHRTISEKSRSWLYHKFSGRNNGKPDDFSDIDRERLKGALVDIANRLRMTADKL